MHKTTLEQWALLEKVVELGSFARAAEETNRSQSSVSYNLALLQERLGVALLAPSGRRAVLNQVKPLLQAFAYVETHAATLRNGARTRLDLVVDSIFPRQRLFAILRQFQQRYPQTQVRLTEVLENLDDESAARISSPSPTATTLSPRWTDRWRIARWRRGRWCALPIRAEIARRRETPGPSPPLMPPLMR